LSIGGGHRYLSIVLDLKSGAIVFVGEGKQPRPPTDEGGSRPRAVVSSMYHQAVTEKLTQAEIVFDKFHIAKHLNEAVDKVRRAEHKDLKAKGDDRLTGLRQLLMYHPENLDEERSERLSDFLGERKRQQLRTARAWCLKDYFRWFWEYPDAMSAKEFFDEWYAWAIRSRLQPVKRVARMLKSRLKNILSWFRHPISNATAEGFNSRIQLIKSNARGFRNFANYRTRILFFCGKLKLKPC